MAEVTRAYGLDSVGTIINLVMIFGVPLILLTLGLSVGTIVERGHLRRLAAREHAMAGHPCNTLRTLPAGASEGTLVATEIVLSADYLRSFTGKLRNIIGGRVPSFERLTMRARREALLRIRERAAATGYAGLCNVRFEMGPMGVKVDRKKQPVVMTSIIVSATAYRLGHAAAPRRSRRGIA